MYQLDTHDFVEEVIRRFISALRTATIEEFMDDPCGTVSRHLP